MHFGCTRVIPVSQPYPLNPMKTFAKLKVASQTSWISFLSAVQNEERAFAYDCFLTYWAHWNKLAEFVQASSKFTAGEKLHVYAPLSFEKASALFESRF